MESTKYGKYILTERNGDKPMPDTGVKPVVLEGLEDWSGIQHRMKWKFVTKPGVIMDTRHSHEFDEFLVFLSCNPADELEFTARIAEHDVNMFVIPLMVRLFLPRIDS